MNESGNAIVNRKSQQNKNVSNKKKTKKFILDLISTKEKNQEYPDDLYGIVKSLVYPTSLTYRKSPKNTSRPWYHSQNQVDSSVT